MRTLFQIIQQEFQKENDLVLASIVASSGSTPRGAGSRMLVGKKGRVAGTIGGGSVEYRAELMALDILEKKESCEHEFRLNRKDVENIGICLFRLIHLLYSSSFHIGSRRDSCCKSGGTAACCQSDHKPESC